MRISDHFIWKFKKKLIANYNYKNRPRRQKIEPKYLENGSFYIFNAKKFSKYKNRLFGKIGVYEMTRINSLQLDEPEDIKLFNSLKNFINMSVFIIAEIGINHNGDMKICKKLIDLAVMAGCDAVKFQKRDIETVYSKEMLDSFRESPWEKLRESKKWVLNLTKMNIKRLINIVRKKN